MAEDSDQVTPAEPPGSPHESFVQPVTALLRPLIDLLHEELTSTTGLTDNELDVLSRCARQFLVRSMQLKLNRVLLLELQAASLAGQLDGADDRARWTAFLHLAAGRDFRDHLSRRYPTLFDRAETAGRQLIAAISLMARRLTTDRAAITELLGTTPGALRSVWLDAGDPHRGGQSVARLDFDGGAVMYKPRPIPVEAALDGILERLLPGPGRIRTPRMVTRDGYGWTSFVQHTLCADDAETELFYRNLGRWLAVMHLVGGIDLHSDNIIADGPVPVVIDAETMLTPLPAIVGTGCGAASDLAAEMQHRGVLRIGLLPVRMSLLADLDLSGVGNLPGQQPPGSAITIVDVGTDRARLAMVPGQIAPSRNHPNAHPAPHRFWGHIVAGFAELSTQLRAIDADGELVDLLRPLLGCEVRLVLRSTRVYTDLRRMLWHPASLHDEPAAVARARTVLRRHTATNPDAPGDPDEIDAEIADLLVGDIPIFTKPVDQAMVETAVADWRASDLRLAADLITFSVLSAFHHEVPRTGRSAIGRVRQADHEALRRRSAAAGVARLRDSAVRGSSVKGSDGTATWVGPALSDVGWSVRVLPADVYGGQAGVAVCLAGYLHEARHGRADPVAGLDELLHDALVTLRATEDLLDTGQCGGLTGLGSQIWAWSELARLLGERTLLDRAQERASLFTLGPEYDNRADLLCGVAGMIVPLLGLAERTGNPIWWQRAAIAGDHLVKTARHDERGACWPATGFPNGTGGFGYGVAGGAWALTRLAHSPAGTTESRAQWRAVADAALDFQHALDRSPPATWPDPAIDRPTLWAGWCHGRAGVGLAAADLYRHTGESRFRAMAERAATDAAALGLGRGRTLCHGDPALWELINTVRGLDPTGPVASLLPDLDAQVLHTLASPAANDVADASDGTAMPDVTDVIESTAPGLLTGVAGTVFTLLRLHPEHQLRSPLLLDVGPA